MFYIIGKSNLPLRLLAFGTTLSFLLSGCGKTEKQDVFGTNNYKLEVIDSVSFDRLSTLELLDYQESTEQLLLFDTQLSEVLLVDKDGSLLLSFNPLVDGPEYMGNESFGWNFYEEDKILGFGRTHFYTYSKQGKRLERYEYPTEVNSWWLLDYRPKMLFTYPHAGQTEVLAIITGVTTPNFKTQAYQDSARINYAMNFATGEFRTVFGKPAHSIYRTIGAYVDRGWPVIMDLKKGRFAMTYHADSNIYIMDATKDRVLNTIPIPKAHQPVYETVSFGEKGSPDLTRINASLISTGDKVILRSFGIIPESIKRQIKATEKGRWWESDAYKEASRTYSKNNALVFDEERFLGELEWNVGKINYDIISTENGFFWVQRRYENERDYRTFLKVKVVKSVL